ncbi:hypothetical protein PMZ80_002720 [Knufia obscura]|uniref:Uncharacterized protein n=1 Tax=Knufia obscura TaxID=1635080 RepID=A0ABR0RZ30_9EURO|nr:hypothetical protein PMZ80_002720 [Knufia obscura]
MAAPFNLQTLLAGPQATIDHDDNGDGSYQHLGGPYSLAMLTYFSTTIQQQCTGGVNGSAYMLQASRIHILKGNALALHDIFNWMQVCCGSGRLCALSEVVQNSIRYLLALGAARQLGVQLLEHEVHQTAFRLQTELLTTDQMAAIAAELDSFLREIQDAVIGNIARSFATGRLPDVKRYLGLCTTFEKFHQDVAAALQALKKCNWHPHAGEAEAAWLRKEKLKVEPGQAVPPMMGAIMPAPGPFMHQAFPAQQIPIPLRPLVNLGRFLGMLTHICLVKVMVSTILVELQSTSTFTAPTTVTTTMATATIPITITDTLVATTHNLIRK